MLLRRALAIPRVLLWLAVALFALATLFMCLYADSAPLLAVTLVTPLMTAGGFLCGRATDIEQRRAERAAKCAEIERDLNFR